MEGIRSIHGTTLEVPRTLGEAQSFNQGLPRLLFQEARESLERLTAFLDEQSMPVVSAIEIVAPIQKALGWSEALVYGFEKTAQASQPTFGYTTGDSN